MRDLVLSLALAILVPLSAMHPWIGAMCWTWISLMSPHRLTYGFMYDAPVAILVGGATLLGLVFSKEPKRLPLAAPLVWLAFFSVWMVVTFPFSINPGDYNAGQLDKVLKIMFMTFVVVTVLHTRKHVDILIAVTALSVGFYGIKGGFFALATGGSMRIYGPHGFIAGNNEVGLALVMTIPLLYYLQTQAPRKWLGHLMWVAIFLTAVAAVSTHSRGSMLAICAMAIAFLIRSPKRGKLVLPIIVIFVFIVSFMPDAWWARMDTIGTYKEDESAMGRINAWIVAWNVATNHFFGGGFYLESDTTFLKYAPNPAFIAVAHSIYFQVLGQHGFVGLFLFLAFWLSTLRTGIWIHKHSTSQADKTLARTIEISLIGYAVGGAFLNLAYFDGPYYLMAAMVVLRYKIMKNQPSPVLRPVAAANSSFASMAAKADRK